MSSVISSAIAGVAPAPKKVSIGSENSVSDGGAASVPNEEAAPATSAVASYNPLNITTYDFRANVKVLQVPHDGQERLIDLVG